MIVCMYHDYMNNGNRATEIAHKTDTL